MRFAGAETFYHFLLMLDAILPARRLRDDYIVVDDGGKEYI